MGKYPTKNQIEPGTSVSIEMKETKEAGDLRTE